MLMRRYVAPALAAVLALLAMVAGSSLVAPAAAAEESTRFGMWSTPGLWTHFDHDGHLGDHRLLDPASQAAWREIVTGGSEPGEPVVTTTATVPDPTSVRWTNLIDPAGGTWYVACTSWYTGGGFYEDPPADRRVVSGDPDELVCTRSGLPADADVAVRVKLYDSSGVLRYRSEKVFVFLP